MFVEQTKVMHLKIVFILLFASVAIPISAQQSNLLKQDTLYIDSISGHTITFSAISKPNQPVILKYERMDSIQIDGKGRYELVFKLSEIYYYNIAKQTCQYFDETHYEVIEIWNLDSKKKLFTAITNYRSEFDHWNAYNFAENREGAETYSYTFTIDSSGIILLAAFQQETTPKLTEDKKEKEPSRIIQPDQSMGEYYFDPETEQYIPVTVPKMFGD